MATLALDPTAHIISHATEALDGRERAMRWQEKSSDSFGGRSPLEVLALGDPEEVKRVDDILTALDYGMHI
jgi:uncharacterized protein (DUF2384 family)